MISDLHRAVRSLWTSSGLDAKFTADWDSSVPGEFLTLHDQEASPSTPLPYCVYEQETPSIATRMSGHTALEKHHVRDVPWAFKVHGKQTSTESAKEVCVRLIEEILKVFGGHPTVSPTAMTLNNGSFLIAQYQSDWGVRTGDEEYSWYLKYNFKVDVPVAV